MSSNVKKLPKLPPLPRLRVKKPVLQQESSPCLVIMSNLLNCWSSNGDGSNLCKGLEVNLKQCMETTDLYEDWLHLSEDSNKKIVDPFASSSTFGKEMNNDETDEILNSILKGHNLKPSIQHNNVTSLKENQIFESIFESLKENKPKPPRSRSRPVQAVFEKNSQNSGYNNMVSLLDKDFRDVPIMTSSYLSADQGVSDKLLHKFKESESEFCLQERKLQPLLLYIESLETNFEVVEWFDRNILSLEAVPKDNSIKSKDVTATPLNRVNVPIILYHLMRRCSDSPESFQYMFKSVKENLEVFTNLTQTCKMYNLALETVFDRTEDLAQVLEVINEMKLNGVLGDLNTLKILLHIKVEVLSSFKRDVLESSAAFYWSGRHHHIMEKIDEFCNVLRMKFAL